MGQLLETEEVSAGSSVASEPVISSINTTGSASHVTNEALSTAVTSAISSSLTSTVANTTPGSNFMSTSWAQENDSSQALDEAMAQLDDELGMDENSIFQRSHSLPRGFGKTNAQGLEVEAVPSVDKYNQRMKKPMVASAPGSESNLLMAGMRRQRVRVSTWWTYIFSSHSPNM